MTIHSDWSRLFHEECPDAFSSLPPRTGGLKVGVIDGHLQLMSLHKGLASWDAFLQYLFVKPIMQLFQAGCPRVVLCFDCYDYVPAYKAMTQVKRVQHASKPVCVFNADHGLPATIPDDPMLFLMNRQFKIKLVEMICERMPALIQAQITTPAWEFIIDYKRAVLYSTQGIPRIMDEIQPMGESDVKFCRYVDLYGSALVHAIDGDYLAIALLYYTQRAMGSNNQIHIYRQLSSFPTPEARADKKKPVKPATRKKPVKCWVDMQLLYITLFQAMWQGVGNAQTLTNMQTQQPFTNADAVHAVVFLMLLAGTDFSRPLPWLGPRRLWDHLPNIAVSLLQAASLQTQTDVTIPITLDWVVSKLYRLVFEKHCCSSSSYDHVLASLQHSKLSLSVKSKFPSRNQLTTTVQNVAWVMTYWKTHNGLADTDLDGRHGFVRCPASGSVTYVDLLLKPLPI